MQDQREPRRPSGLSGLRPLVWVAAVSAAVFLGGSWFLNSTRPGLDLKCRLLNDVGACLVEAFSAPAPVTNVDPPAPPATPDPAQVRAAQQTSIDSAASRVRSALADLAAIPQDYNGVLAGAADHLASMKGDLTTATSDRASVGAEAGSEDPTVVCGDATVVAGDATVLDGDLTVIEGDGTSLEGSFTGLDSDIMTLNDAVSRLHQAMAVLPDYRPASAPSDSEISAALDAASQAKHDAQARYDQLHATAEGYVKQAHDLADAAQSICERVG